MLVDRPTPRWYQAEARDATINKLMESPENNPLIQLPTASGKSLTLNDLMLTILQYWPATRFLVLCPTKELVGQDFASMLRLWPDCPAGIYCAGLRRRDTLHPVIYGTIASVARTPQLFGIRQLLIIDEAHLVSPEDGTMLQKIIKELRELYPPMQVVGLSATGWRQRTGSIVGPLDTFNCLSYDLTTPEGFQRLIREGFLVPVISKRTFNEIDVSNVGVSNGEFKQNELEQAANKEKITYDALCEAFDLGSNARRGIVFASGIAHAESIAAILDSWGVPVATVHSRTSAKDRDRLLAAHKEGKVFFLIGNNIFVAGYDDPILDLMIDLQPVMSVGKHVQKNGRLMRPCIETGKTFGLGLDFGGNIRRNGPIDAPYIPDKRGKSNRTGDAPVKICDFCNAYNYTIARFCVHCGGEFIFETKLTSTASTVNAMIGDLPDIKTFEVDHVSYTRHEKLNMPASVKVVYSCTIKEGQKKSHRQFSEYVCIEHPGGIAKKAQNWWMQRHPSCPPASTDAVLQRSNELKKPRMIRVHVNRKYPEILGYEF